MRNWRSSHGSRAAARAVAVTLGRFWGEVKYTRQRKCPGRFLGRDTFVKRPKLLDFYRRTGGFERGLGLVGVGLGDLLEHGLGGTVDEVLRFLQTQAGECTHFLDHLDLLVATRGQDDVVVTLLVRRRRVSTGTAACGDRG